jgi:hypothetical protein
MHTYIPSPERVRYNATDASPTGMCGEGTATFTTFTTNP